MRELITRPQAEDKKINSKDNFELCYIRHQYFRRVKYNPTEQEMKPYRKIVKKIAADTYYLYISLFRLIGMELDDILSIANIHLVNFLGLFELDKEKNLQKYEEFTLKYQRKNNGDVPSLHDILEKNKADYTLFMKQRMTDLIRICQQKAKNIKGFRVESYIPFRGPELPPSKLRILLDDYDSLGFKKIDAVVYKAIKKRVKGKDGEVFQFAGNYYVAVPLKNRELTILDLAGAGLDPHESNHNKNPEQLMVQREQEIKFDKNKEMFDNYPKEEKIKVIKLFVENNLDNPRYEKEILTAKRMLRRFGIENG